MGRPFGVRPTIYWLRNRQVDAVASLSYCFEMNIKHSGSCLCGAVRFEIAGDFEHFYLCHCQHCRKDTGSAHAANLFSSKASLKWLAGQDKVTVFNLPNTRH